VPDGKNPQSWNRYSYTRNNPVKYNDPSGHGECDPIDGHCEGGGDTGGKDGGAGGCTGLGCVQPTQPVKQVGDPIGNATSVETLENRYTKSTYSDGRAVVRTPSGEVVSDSAGKPANPRLDPLSKETIDTTESVPQVTNQSGGVRIEVQGDVTIGRDVVGRDKNVNTTVDFVLESLAGATPESLKAYFEGVNEVLRNLGLIP
jgi:hypothetical protein